MTHTVTKAPRIGPTNRARRRLMCALPALLAAPAPPAHADATGAIVRPWPRGRVTPPLVLPGYEGPTWNLADARGEVVLLNFWASWCEPCRAELPSLELLAQRHEADRLTVVAVNHRESDAALRRFMALMPITLPIVRDADGAAALAWQVRVFPTTVAVGRDGRAAFSVVGEADWAGAAARQWLRPLL